MSDHEAAAGQARELASVVRAALERPDETLPEYLALAELERRAAALHREQQTRETLETALNRLADHYRLEREPHDPEVWHGGMAENIAACPVCYVAAALAASLAADANECHICHRPKNGEGALYCSYPHPVHERVPLSHHLKTVREGLTAMLDMFDRHSGWCGHNKNAPGDYIINSAPEKAREALAALDRLAASSVAELRGRLLEALPSHGGTCDGTDRAPRNPTVCLRCRAIGAFDAAAESNQVTYS